MIEDLKLQIWLDPDRTIRLRIEHDTKNGSAISSSGANLAEALQNLAIAIQKTNLSDPIWKEDLISGDRQLKD